MYAGEGEPLLHKDIYDIIKHTKGVGIDTAITTNGTLLKKELSIKILKFLTWIRISLNAGNEKNYARIHHCEKGDFNKVLDNIKMAVNIRDENKLTTTIGVQLVMIPENIGDIFLLAKLLKNMGVDYFTVKPYSRHPFSYSSFKEEPNYKDYFYLGEKLQKIQTNKFKVIFRYQTMDRLRTNKGYRRCLGLPFWSYIDSKGDVYACSSFLGRKDFCYGNIYKDTFRDILNSKRRKDILTRITNNLDVARCRKICRLDKINSYLWDLKKPTLHINFI